MGVENEEGGTGWPGGGRVEKAVEGDKKGEKKNVSRRIIKSERSRAPGENREGREKRGGDGGILS